MSTDYDVCCLDCLQSNAENRLAHLGLSDLDGGDTLCEKLAKPAHAFAILYDAKLDAGLTHDDVRVCVWTDQTIDLAWFAKHASHRLGVIDEYSRTLGLCGTKVKCSCGDRFYCMLDRGHDGEHMRHRVR